MLRNIQIAPRLYYAPRGHIFKLYIYCKNYTIINAVSYTTDFIFLLAAREPALSKGCGPLP